MSRSLRRTRATAAAALLALTTLTPAANVSAQRVDAATRRARRAPAEVAASAPRARRDAQIAAMLREVDARNVERIIRKLVSFGTRNTLSAQDNPTRGIGAARDWIHEEFRRISRETGGRLEVSLQTFEQQPGQFPRIARPTRITNVVATLRGTQPESEARTYVVSGHYDSMCSSPTDGECDAPGANDDASGTAAVIELARVMSKRRFDATVVFMAVAGEEQGLVGATYFAEQAKQQNTNVEAMFTNDIVGNTLGGNGVRDRRTVRVFSEGVPSNETTEDAATRR
ncbi:MAG TPA: M20/M25/M40 family metallo-hydrolase, partial [Pyrinomonadaceae bacterium]|nr:M20/M25/M40 family metallo-hydrolase [Pyrinomonadaceae bacterium]